MSDQEKQPTQKKKAAKNGAATKALKAAAKKGDIGGIRAALASGADIDGTGQRGHESALWLAAGNGHFLAVQYLVQQGADINTGSFNLSPSGKAFRKGFLEIVEYLSASVEVSSEERLFFENNLIVMALDLDKNHNACKHLVFLAEKILKRSDSLALHLACLKKNTKAIRILLKMGFDLNKKCKIYYHEPEMTPLQCVCYDFLNKNRSVNIAKMLLEHGADPFIRNKRGRTALDMAEINYPTDTLEKFLSKAMAERKNIKNA